MNAYLCKEPGGGVAHCYLIGLYKTTEMKQRYITNILFTVPLQVQTITNDIKPFQLKVCLQVGFVGECAFMAQ